MCLKYLSKLLIAAVCMACSIGTIAQQVYTIPLSKPGEDGRLIAKMNDISIKVSGYDEKVVKVSVTKNGRQSDQAGILFDFFENNNTITVIRKIGPKVKGVLLSIEVPRNFSINVSTYWNESIEVSGIKGDVKAKAYYGGLSIEKAEGNLELSSYFGNIRANGISGSVVADNSNGSIELSFSKLLQSTPMALSNVYGDIILSLPGDSKASLTIGTYKGVTHSDFILQPAINTNSDKNSKTPGFDVHRTINGGGVDMKLKTYTGNIILKKI